MMERCSGESIHEVPLSRAELIQLKRWLALRRGLLGSGVAGDPIVKAARSSVDTEIKDELAGYLEQADFEERRFLLETLTVRASNGCSLAAAVMAVVLAESVESLPDIRRLIKLREAVRKAIAITESGGSAKLDHIFELAA